MSRRPGSRATRLARIYFLAQALAVAAWWLGIALRPAWRAAFAIRGAPDAALLAFAPGDLAILSAGALAAAVLGEKFPPLAWLVAGGTVYATFYTIAAVFLAAAPPLGALLMVPAALLALLAARRCSHAYQRHLPPGRPGEPVA